MFRLMNLRNLCETKMLDFMDIVGLKSQGVTAFAENLRILLLVTY